MPWAVPEKSDPVPPYWVPIAVPCQAPDFTTPSAVVPPETMSPWDVFKPAAERPPTKVVVAAPVSARLVVVAFVMEVSPRMVFPPETTSPADEARPPPATESPPLQVEVAVEVKVMGTVDWMEPPETVSPPEEARPPVPTWMPASKVEVPATVERSVPPERRSPPEELMPAEERPPVKVEVAAPVTARFVVVAALKDVEDASKVPVGPTVKLPATVEEAEEIKPPWASTWKTVVVAEEVASRIENGRPEAPKRGLSVRRFAEVEVPAMVRTERGSYVEVPTERLSVAEVSRTNVPSSVHPPTLVLGDVHVKFPLPST